MSRNEKIVSFLKVFAFTAIVVVDFILLACL